KQRIILSTVCLAVLVAQIDTSVVNLVLRPIGATFGIGVSTLQWVVDAYNLAYACLLLTGGRALTGIGAALALPNSLAILTVAFPDDRARARAIGVWASCNGIGLAIGPTLGGLLAEHAGWRSVFLVIVPVSVAGVAMALRAVPDSADPRGRRLDLAGQALAVVALAGPVLAVIEAPAHGWTSPAILAASCLGAAALLLFLLVQRGREDGMM